MAASAMNGAAIASPIPPIAIPSPRIAGTNGNAAADTVANDAANPTFAGAATAAAVPSATVDEARNVWAAANPLDITILAACKPVPIAVTTLFIAVA